MNPLVFPRADGSTCYVSIKPGKNDTPAMWNVRWEGRDFDGHEPQAESGGIFSDIDHFLSGMSPARDPRLISERSSDELVSREQLVTSMTVDEGRVILGYCAHVCEHGNKHARELSSAVMGSVHRRDLEVAQDLMEELDDVICVIDLAKQTAELLLGVNHEQELA